ncbi:MAG: MFS transporter [Betaproteobacteria bacterium]|nr:MFS transporter [Betaproteobacteria bacterium]NBT10373.1 MFS transporter [Betaproteobacteria bacterium]NBU49758.1 MFS transporter [Betaproteobacteria bacterium]
MNLATATSAGPAEPDRARDVETIALVGLAHGTSHFFHLLLPPLFPMLAAEGGFSYAELGLLVTVFFVISGVGQALAGFVVDRVGAWPVLMGAMASFALAAIAAAGAQGYAGFMVAAALAGVGNAPFHPADFSILNQRVSPSRLGHAFSVHGISGNLGWAAAPLVIAGVAAWSGSWRWAMLVCALWALFVAALLWWRASALKPLAPHGVRAEGASTGPGQAGTPLGAPPKSAAPTGTPGTSASLAFLRLPSVWVCFSFFFWSTCALAAVQSFLVPAMSRLYAEPLGWLALMITGYMVASAVGMVLGGFVVKSSVRLERNIAWALTAAAALLLLAGSGWLPALFSGVLVALAGLGTGLAGPSRDMLIRQAAPVGATGRVYGTVYSGLDVGFAVSAPVFGWLLDHDGSSILFVGAAAALLLGVASAAWVGRRLPGRASVVSEVMR